MYAHETVDLFTNRVGHYKRSLISPLLYLLYTANKSAVKITVFRRVPFPAVIPLYYLHSITALSTVEKCKHRFKVVYYKIYTFTW